MVSELMRTIEAMGQAAIIMERATDIKAQTADVMAQTIEVMVMVEDVIEQAAKGAEVFNQATAVIVQAEEAKALARRVWDNASSMIRQADDAVESFPAVPDHDEETLVHADVRDLGEELSARSNAPDHGEETVAWEKRMPTADPSTHPNEVIAHVNVVLDSLVFAMIVAADEMTWVIGKVDNAIEAMKRVMMGGGSNYRGKAKAIGQASQDGQLTGEDGQRTGEDGQLIDEDGQVSKRPILRFPAILGNLAVIYESMPDGSTVNMNKIFNVIDEVLGGKKRKKRIIYLEAERFMYQYKDAYRILEMVSQRHKWITEQPSYAEKRFMRDPTIWVENSDAYSDELPGLEVILNMAEKECLMAKISVGAMICRIENEWERLLLTAHYICMADWKWISTVFGFKPRWAKDSHVKAMSVIDDLLRMEIENDEIPHAEVDCEINRLIRHWRDMELKCRKKVIEKENAEEDQQHDDLKMILGLG